MRKKFFLPFMLLALSACQQQNKPTENTVQIEQVDAATAPVFSFDKESYDFGQITEGEKVAYDFKFTNTGKSPLIISNAVATCGCTVPEYPKKPLAPGEQGNIHVVFNSTGKAGMQNKVITLTANTAAGTHELHLIGDVKSKNK